MTAPRNYVPVRGSARFIPRSCNRKLSPVDMVPYDGVFRQLRPTPRAPFVCSTYTAIDKTCDDSCTFKARGGERRGCFADDGFTRILSDRLNAAAEWASPEQVVAEEVRLIDAAWRRRVPQDGARGGRDMRLHVGGDVGSAEGARMLAGAAERWRRRGGGLVWTYTHSWRTIPRADWGAFVSVLASVERPAELAEARLRGYAAAIVVERFPNGAKAWMVRGTRVIPCPAETRGTNCADCRLCLGEVDLVAMRAAIAFEVHGAARNVAVRSLLRKIRPGAVPEEREPRAYRCGDCGGLGHGRGSPKCRRAA
jgi:hypothetical protein